jgi:hypothetical protein
MLTAVEYDERRFAEIVLYVAKRIEDDPRGGAIKLNKILYFADFAHQRAFGRPITWAEYQRLPMGPAPRRLKPVRELLVAQGDAVLRSEMLSGYEQKRLVALRDPDHTILNLSDDERRMLDDAIKMLWGRTGWEASELSHRPMAWQLISDFETIPYEYANIIKPVLTPRFRERLASIEQQYAPPPD